MKFLSIATQESMDRFIFSSRMWKHAFIREIYAISPSYQLASGQGTVNPDEPIDLYILIMTGIRDNPAVELLFRRAEKVEISFVSEISLQGSLKEDRLGHKWIAFSLGSSCWIQAQRIAYRFLGNEVLGNRTNYSIGIDHNFWE